MAFTLTWAVRVGDIAGMADLSSYTINASVDLNADLGFAGRSTATVTLNNNTGAFTPGGTGTYASTDWFAKALHIQATAGGTTKTAFVGLIESFDIAQLDAKNSTVTIQAIDIATLMGRAQIGTSLVGTYALSSWVALIFAGNPSYFNPPLPMPTMASTTALASQAQVASNGLTTSVSGTQLQANARFGDWLNNQVLTAGPATLWAYDYNISADRWYWNILVIDRLLNRSTLATTFTMVDASSAVTSGQLPFEDIHVGYQTEELTNSAQVRDNLSSFTQVTTTDSTSQSKYGPRARNYTQTAAATQADVTNASQFWANRYGTVRYIPDSVVLTYSGLKALAVDDGAAQTAFLKLCSAYDCIWNQISLTYKGAGMSSAQTTQLIATGRKLAITPDQTRIELRLKSGADNQTFTLNSSTYGVLDTNRLG